MCVAILVPKGIPVPSDEILKQAADHNRDGGSVSWPFEGKVHWAKGLTAEEVIEVARQIQHGPCIIHFRIATTGGKIPELCHPFGVTHTADTRIIGEAPMVLVHNGHWSDWERVLLANLHPTIPVPPGPWSDTRAMAWLASVYGVGVLQFLREKIATLDASGDLRYYGQGWSEKDGIYYSNLNHERTYVSGYGGPGDTAPFRTYPAAWEEFAEDGAYGYGNGRGPIGYRHKR